VNVSRLEVESVEIAFTLNKQPIRLRVGADRRLLDVLREDLRLTGAKEGCGKGECGACTVLLDGRAVDACLMMAYQVDGGAVETIEGLVTEDAEPRLHPLQEAFIDRGAVQCGICIPGMILAAKAVLDRNPFPAFEDIRLGLGGNLCRCTGYTKILEAVTRAAGAPWSERPTPRTPAAYPSFYRPRSLEQALEILAQEGDPPRPVAGGTDLLVAAKDGVVRRSLLFDLTAVPELAGIEERQDHIWIGAAVTHSEILASPLVAQFCPALPEACALIGGPQIRNRGTIGGNLAHGSPAADTVPALYAADAVVEVVALTDRKDVPISEFFVGPKQTVLARDELILGVRIPKRPGLQATFLRLGQRQAQAISKVSVAVAMTFRGGRPDWVRVAFGAVAPTVIRAPKTERALLEASPTALEKAKDAARSEVRPIDDLRSTREYRREMAAVLLERAVRRLNAT
jgi:carbon-monoxide dehydrogenase small subunit/xanthine dehydrogenase small subunit